MKRCTVEEFERFTELPENADRLFEYIGAEIRESISRPYASAVTAAINLYLHLFLEKQKSSYITGKKGGYVVSGDCYLPDLAYVSNARLPQLRVSGYLRNPPNLAVEVQSPIDADSQHFLEAI